MRYVQARYTQSQREWAYRFFISENLRILNKNIATEEKGEKCYFEKSLYDILNPKPVDTRTGEEIADDVLKKLAGE